MKRVLAITLAIPLFLFGIVVLLGVVLGWLRHDSADPFVIDCLGLLGAFAFPCLGATHILCAVFPSQNPSRQARRLRTLRWALVPSLAVATFFAVSGLGALVEESVVGRRTLQTQVLSALLLLMAAAAAVFLGARTAPDHRPTVALLLFGVLLGVSLWRLLALRFFPSLAPEESTVQILLAPGGLTGLLLARLKIRA